MTLFPRFATPTLARAAHALAARASARLSAQSAVVLVMSATLAWTGGTSARQASRESWETYYLGGTKIGYAQRRISSLEAEGRTLRQWKDEARLRITRFGQQTDQNVTLTWVETPSGELVSCETRISSALGDVVTRGRLVQDQLELTTTTAGKNQIVRLEWRKGWGGFFAVEQSLQQQPMQPHQRRRLRALLPMFNVVADIDLQAVGYEQTALLTSRCELLRIRATTRLPDGNTLETIMWADREGCPLKTVMPGMGQETYVTTRETALDESGYAGLDVGRDMVVRIDRPWDAPHATRRVVYRVELAREDPAKVFASGLNQQVQPLDAHRAMVTVQAIRPDQPARADGDPGKPEPGDLRANSLIQSDDPQVVAMAVGIAPQEKDPWRLAQSLEKGVGEAIEAKDFSQAFSTAAEVAQTRQGDCTEHAVLLAAVCRARQIPARVSIGLVYSAAEEGFAFHMWNEVWIRDRWIPLDATLGQGGIGAAHLKLADSDLDGAGAYSTFLPVLHVMGQLKLEIVEVQ